MLTGEAFFMNKKIDGKYQAEAPRMEEELVKARARAMEGIDHVISKGTEAFLLKRLKIMKLPYQMCQKERQLRRSNQDNLDKTLYPQVKFQSASYSSWSNTNDQFCEVLYIEDRSTIRRRQQRSVHENDVSKIISKFVQEQSAPQVDTETFEGNQLEFTYFMVNVSRVS